MLVLAQYYLVDKFGWLSIEEFTELVAIAEVTPGPIIVNLATFSGTKLAGFPGAVSATAGLLVIPFTSLFLIAHYYSTLKGISYFQRLLVLLKPAAAGLILAALINLVKGSITGILTGVLAGGVFISVFFLKINPIIVVISVFILAGFWKF